MGPGSDPFGVAGARTAPPSAGGSAPDGPGVAAGPLPTVVATAAVLASLGLTAVRLLLPDLLPASAASAALGFLLTPWTVMAALVVVQLHVLRGGDADPERPAAVEGRLRRLHVLAVGSFVVAVPHVVVLAQLFELWWSGR